MFSRTASFYNSRVSTTIFRSIYVFLTLLTLVDSIPLDLKHHRPHLRLLPTMSPFMISRYYILTVTFSAFYFDYAHSFPECDLPGKKYDECFQFAQVEENAKTVEELGLHLGDLKHVCSIEGTRGRSLCFVVSVLQGEEYQSTCHEFNVLDLKIWHYKYPNKVLDVIVLRDGKVRWYLDCTAASHDDVRVFYSMMKYHSRERNLRELGEAIDLQKKTGIIPKYEVFAIRPSVYVDESVRNVSVIHIIGSRDDGNGILLIMLRKSYAIFLPEDHKVYMSLREYRSDSYFFTCASPTDAEQLCNAMAVTSQHGHAITRYNPVFLF